MQPHSQYQFLNTIALRHVLGFFALYLCFELNTLQASEDTQEEKKSTVRLVLSIDGGGMRGILPARLLLWWEDELNDHLNKIYPQAPKAQAHIGECFDLGAGTSTGGIIVLGGRLLAPKSLQPQYEAKTLVKLYEEEGEKIFPSQQRERKLGGWLSPKYTPQGLENLLDQYFGKASLRDLAKPTLITTYNVVQEELMVFKSHVTPTQHVPSRQNYQLKDVARATSAAPTYFPAVTIKSEDDRLSTCIDGGVTANNPTMLAYLEAQRLYPGDKFHIISLSCGQASLFLPESKNTGGKLNWAADITGVVLNSSSSMIDQCVDQMATLRGDKYTRVRFTLDQKAQELDSATPANMKKLEGYALREINNPSSAMHEIKHVLFDYYKARDNYVHHELIKGIKAQLTVYPDQLDFSHYPYEISERALWEMNHFAETHKLVIHALNLEGTPLTTDLLQHLKYLKELTILNLDNTHLDETGLKTLKTLIAYGDQPGLALKTVNIRHNPALETLSAENLVFLLSPYTQVEVSPVLSLKLGFYHQQHGQEKQAIHYYQMNSSDADNKIELIKLYLKEGNEAKRLIEGLKLCEGLAHTGHAEAQYMLGHLYKEPAADLKSHLGDEKTYLNQVNNWYQLAALQGHKNAAYALGGLYEDGHLHISGARDHQAQLQEALKYYRIAQKAGSQAAVRKIQSIENMLKNSSQ